MKAHMTFSGSADKRNDQARLKISVGQCRIAKIHCNEYTVAPALSLALLDTAEKELVLLVSWVKGVTISDWESLVCRNF